MSDRATLDHGATRRSAPALGRPTAELDGTAASSRERQILDRVDLYLQRGIQLRRWWDEAVEKRRFADSFPLATTANRPDLSFGFFDETTIDGRPMPIMGNFQTMFFDRPKTPGGDRRAAALWMRDQIREFVLHYFMRVSNFRQPQAVVEEGRPEPPALLEPLSWCPRDRASAIGFGFSQLFYRNRDDDEVKLFPPAERKAIVDLRRIGPELAWIALKVKIFDFAFTFVPVDGGPSLSLPLDEESYLVVSPDFVLDETAPAPGELGHYGLGYAFIKNPEPGVLAYGPGEFDAAIELIDFHVYEDGQVRVTMVFVANRPNRIVNFDPVDWGFRGARALSLGLAAPFLAPFERAWQALPKPPAPDPVLAGLALANAATAGYAGRELCISRRGLDTEFLLKHFQQHYQTIVGSLQTWRQIPDWLDRAALPRWVTEGQGA